MGWKEFSKWMDKPIMEIKVDNSHYFICSNCSYKWATRKRIGTPSKCPHCNSKSIFPYQLKWYERIADVKNY